MDHGENRFIKKAFPVSLLLDNVTGEANIGGVFRLADAFNIQRIIFTGTPPNLQSRRLGKTARSTQNLVSHEFREDPLEIIRSLKASGAFLLALEITRESIPLEDFSFPSRPLCLILGNEVSGIDPQLLGHCDNILHINMYGRNSSMNVAQATAIALYEITKSIQAFHKK